MPGSRRPRRPQPLAGGADRARSASPRRTAASGGGPSSRAAARYDPLRIDRGTRVMTVPEYYNRINPDLLRVVPTDARVVVEVGCGAGAMGAQFKRINPRTRYVGIELHPEAARIAAERLDHVVAG